MDISCRDQVRPPRCPQEASSDMRNITKVIPIAAMLAFPVASFAQTAPAAPAKSTATKPAASSKKVATKSASGTVKSVSDSQLVITKGKGKSAKDETFVVN